MPKPTKASYAGAELVKIRWAKTTPEERSAFAKSISRGAGGRPPIETECEKCGRLQPSASAARQHCRNKRKR